MSSTERRDTYEYYRHPSMVAAAQQPQPSTSFVSEDAHRRRTEDAALLVASTPSEAVAEMAASTSRQPVVGGRSADIWPQFLWRRANHEWTGGGTHQCIPIQAQIPEKVDLLQFQLLFALLYFAVWCSAIFGNLSVIYVVTLKQVKMSSVRSVFICSLAVSDALLSLTSLPITAVSIFTRDWVFPRPFCNLIGVFQGGSVFVSSFTLTAIAVDRYILVRHPASEKINVNNAMRIVVLIWIVGYSFALPVGIFSSTESYQPFCGLFCEEFWPDSDEMGVSQMRKSYGILVLIIQFGLPAAISSLCYWTIGRIIGEQLVKREKQQIIFQENRNRLENRKSRSNRMMLVMVMGLVLAWLPMNLINLWRDFESAERHSEWYSLIFAACHVIAMTSAVWNPLIYSWFNPQFKETLRRAVERRKRRRRSHESAANVVAPATPSTIVPNHRSCCVNGGVSSAAVTAIPSPTGSAPNLPTMLMMRCAKTLSTGSGTGATGNLPFPLKINVNGGTTTSKANCVPPTFVVASPTASVDGGSPSASSSATTLYSSTTPQHYRTPASGGGASLSRHDSALSPLLQNGYSNND